jgi:hypothetical protein
MFKSNLVKILKKYDNIRDIVTIEEPYGSSNVFLIKFNKFMYKNADCLLIHDEHKFIETLLFDSKLNKCINLGSKKNHVTNVASLVDKIICIKKKSLLLDFHNKLKNHPICDTLISVSSLNNNHFFIKFIKFKQEIKIRLHTNNNIELILFDKNNYTKIIHSVDEIIATVYRITNVYLNSFI